MAYIVLIKDSAARSLAALPIQHRRRVDRKIRSLADDPRPPGCVKLAGATSGWRVRVGVYRILYTIEDGRLIVTVVEVGHRRDVYRGL